MSELKPYKIFDYIKDSDPNSHIIPPHEVSYKLLGLHKKETIVKGELKKVEFYGVRDLVNDIWDDLCVVEERNYFREGGFVYLRQMDITYMYYDGTSGHTESTNKYFTLPLAIAEGVRRRNNIISELKINVIGLIAMTEQVNALVAEDFAKQLLREIEYELSLYLDGDTLPLINKFFDLEIPFLDNDLGNGTTFRMYIIHELII